MGTSRVQRQRRKSGTVRDVLTGVTTGTSLVNSLDIQGLNEKVEQLKSVMRDLLKNDQKKHKKYKQPWGRLVFFPPEVPWRLGRDPRVREEKAFLSKTQSLKDKLQKVVHFLLREICKPVPVQHIVSYFDGSHCPTLREKPKLFFIQACGGVLTDTGFKTAEEVDSAFSIPYDTISVQTDATPCLPADEPDASSSLPTPSDILVSYSTFPGYVSWRDKKEGSWYMKTLVNIFSKYAHLYDLQTLLMQVTRSISENEEAKGVYKQIPGSFNFLRKHFYFFNKAKW
ncbi:caspase-9-like [Mustelus asterias]